MRARDVADYYRSLVIERKRQRASKSSDTAPVEYVYRRAYSDLGPDEAVRYRIAKKTKTRIYVYDEMWEEFIDYESRTFALNRAEFEWQGYAGGGSRGRYDYYYATEEMALASGRTTVAPEYLETLGLTQPCTRADVQKAYRRLARQHHPDAGDGWGTCLRKLAGFGRREPDPDILGGRECY